MPCVSTGKVVRVSLPGRNRILTICELKIRLDNRGSDADDWGGSCTCPDGTVYQVGANDDACGSLACEGGTPGECKRRLGPWSGREVVCSPKADLQLDVSSSHFSGGLVSSGKDGFAGGAGLSVLLPSAEISAKVIVRDSEFHRNRAVAVVAGTASGGGMLVLMPVTVRYADRGGLFDAPPGCVSGPVASLPRLHFDRQGPCSRTSPLHSPVHTRLPCLSACSGDRRA